MKSYLSKILIILASLVLLSSCFLVPVNAAVKEDESIGTCSYYSGISATFYGSQKFTTCYYEGTYMAVEVKGSASDSASHKVTLSVNIANRDTIKTYTFYTNGNTYKFDYIYLGSSGGSSVILSCSCDDTSVAITVNMTTYSW